jgi:hypothetical protein
MVILYVNSQAANVAGIEGDEIEQNIEQGLF